MSELLDCLKKVELFSDMPEKCLLTQICACGSVQLYMKEQLLFAPQQKVNRLGVVLSGKVRLLHLFPDGNYSLMSTVDAGGVIGAELACTRTQLAPYHAVASADTEIFWLPVTVLMQQGSLPETHRLTCLSHLLTMIAHENIKREYRLAILAQKSLRERILVYLTMQANRLQQTSFSVAFSREEMASYLCVNRSALSHELSLMQREGLISFRKNRFTLHHWQPERTSL